jgi:hypothetical protein
VVLCLCSAGSKHREEFVIEAADDGGIGAFHYTDRRGPVRRSIVMRTADAGVHAKTISSSSFAATGQQYSAADLIYTVSGSAVSWNA